MSKKVEPGHKVVNDESAGAEGNSTVLDDITENSLYQPGMAPLASGNDGAPAGGGEAEPSPDTPDANKAATDEATSTEQQDGSSSRPVTLAALKRSGTVILEKIAKKRGVDISGARNNGQRAEILFADFQEKGNNVGAEDLGFDSNDNDEESKNAPEANTPPSGNDGAPAGGGEAKVVVILTNAGSYTVGGRRYLKGELTKVSPEEAASLLETTLFVKG